MTVKKCSFISIAPQNAAYQIAGVIKNDHEYQLDCDYRAEFEAEDEGTPTRYEVIVTVKEIGPL